MNFKVLIITIIAMVATIEIRIVLLMMNNYEMRTTAKLQEICLNITDKCDDAHNACDRIESLSCNLLGCQDAKLFERGSMPFLCSDDDIDDHGFS